MLFDFKSFSHYGSKDILSRNTLLRAKIPIRILNLMKVSPFDEKNTISN